MEPEATAEQGGDPGAGRILVVDDDPINRTLLERSLCREGHAVEACGDGAGPWSFWAGASGSSTWCCWTS